MMNLCENIFNLLLRKIVIDGNELCERTKQITCVKSNTLLNGGNKPETLTTYHKKDMCEYSLEYH